MAEYTNARSYPVELNTGRMLAPGATANIDATNAHNLALITAQDLILYDADTPPEDPDDLYVNVARRTFVSDEGLTPPATADRGGDIIIGADGVIAKRDAAGVVTTHLSVVVTSEGAPPATGDVLVQADGGVTGKAAYSTDEVDALIEAVEGVGVAQDIVALGSMGATESVDLNGLALVKVTGTLTQNCTIDFTNGTVQNRITLIVTQDGTGGWTLSFTDDGGDPVAIDIETGASEVSVVVIEHNGTDYIVAVEAPLEDYQLLTGKDAANGYCGLDSNARIAHARLGTGGGGSTKFLREDQTWQTVSSGGDSLLPAPDDARIGLGGWAFDPAAACANWTPNAGILFPVLVPIAVTGTISHICWLTIVAGSGGSPANAYGAIYSISGTLLGKTSNQAGQTSLTQQNGHAVAVTAEGGQSLAVTAGDFVWCAFMEQTHNSTPVQLARGAIGSGGLVGDTLPTRAMYTGSGLSTPPSSFNPSAPASGGIQNIPTWFGVKIS